jgi:hypothetical protein
MSFDLDANTASELGRLRRQYRRGTQADGIKAILGDELGRISVDAEKHYYYARIANGEDSSNVTQYGHAFPVMSGGNYFGSEKVGHEVWIAHAIDGELSVIMSDRGAMVEQGKSPRGENPNSPYNKFPKMKHADVFLAQPLNTAQTPGFEVRVVESWYIDDNDVHTTFPGGVIDLTSDVPAVDGDGNNQHLIAGIFINSGGTLESVTSTAQPVETALSWTVDVVEIWNARSARAMPIRFYHLFSGQTLLTVADDWGDGREWITAPRRKNNYTATVAPTVNDDIDLRYEVGSHWIDTVTDRIEICTNSTDGAAVWRLISVESITRTTATTYNVLSTDVDIFANTDTNAVTVNLQAGVQNTPLRITNTGTSGRNVTIAPNGSEHLLGLNNSFVLLDGESLIIKYDTTDGWY